VNNCCFEIAYNTFILLRVEDKLPAIKPGLGSG
jgi:hypothetical protein